MVHHATFLRLSTPGANTVWHCLRITTNSPPLRVHMQHLNRISRTSATSMIPKNSRPNSWIEKHWCGTIETRGVTVDANSVLRILRDIGPSRIGLRGRKSTHTSLMRECSTLYYWIHRANDASLSNIMYKAPTIYYTCTKIPYIHSIWYVHV